MDIDRLNFYPLVIDILTDISRSHFVALDLELSGVPAKDPTTSHQTLQQRYLETKEAAERYQILQIGLTCVEQDLESGQYILKPYNFDLCPLIDERLNVERVFSFQSGAASFLLRSGFNMSRPFTDGVPYLSHAESQLARDQYTKRQDKDAVADIVIKSTDIQSIEFQRRVRRDIDFWLKDVRPDSPSSLTITPVATASQAGQMPDELSRFEKRLVHQLVRTQFPELTAISRRGHIQIKWFDQEREDRIKAERRRDLEDRINRQKGFRWIMQALLGGNVLGIDLREVARHTATGEPIVENLDDIKGRLHRAQAFLRHNPRVLVGHNCFLDLIYIYHTFIGALPSTVEEFRAKVHQLWPLIIDTKYLSTHKCGSINPVSSLEQIAAQLSAEPLPKLHTDVQHDKYESREAFHEAGYDSYLTAQIAVRLSSKLWREGAAADELAQLSSRLAKTQLSTPVRDTEPLPPASAATGFTPSTPGGEWKRVGDKSLGPSPVNDPFTYNPTNLRHQITTPDITLPDNAGMPRFGDNFWKVYGNKLRVFGTEEGLMHVDDQDWRSAGADNDGGVLL